MVKSDLTDDPVFGRMGRLTIQDFADRSSAASGLPIGGRRDPHFWHGTACFEPEPDVLIFADMARWEIQRRQRANQIGNFLPEVP